MGNPSDHGDVAVGVQAADDVVAKVKEADGWLVRCWGRGWLVHC